MADLAEYTLVPGNKNQVLVSRQRQVTSWGRGMTEEQFVDRDVRLEKFEHATGGRLINWVLVPRNDPQSLQFKCSCETYRRRAIVTRPSAAPEEVVAYGIASVFCPPENRRKGYASHMMRLLHHILSLPASLPPFPREWGDPPPRSPDIGGDAQFSVLYSDVGDFYRHCGLTPNDDSGWNVHGPVSTIWKLKSAELNQIDFTDEGSSLLSEEQCITLWENDATHIIDYISQLPVSSRTRFTFLPDQGIAAFVLRRTMAETPLLPKHPLKHWGVTVKSDSSPAYATWTLDLSLWAPPVLVLTRLRASRESFPALVNALVKVAREIGADTMETWNLDASLVEIAANLGGKTAVRTEHLPAVAWYGSENPNDIEWVFNEKFPWC